MNRRTDFPLSLGNRNTMQTVFRGLFIASLVLNGYLIYRLQHKPAAPTETVAAPAGPTQVGGVTVTDGARPPAPPAASPVPDDGGDEGHAAEGTGKAVADTAGQIVDKENGIRLLNLEVKGSLAETFQNALGSDNGDLLSAVFTRIFIWKLDVRSDVRKGDKIEVMYRILPEENLVDIKAARYHSIKNGETYSAYWYQPPGRPFGSYYDEKGVEVPLTLENCPIQGYEQITALLRDRSRHKGMDFKTPVGTKVSSPFRGKVTRINWKSPNGNCVEIEYADSKVRGMFLHLSRILPGIVPGKTVAAGEPIAESGNTGHSTAPHLHYQLEKPNGDVIDPLDFHKTHNETLPTAVMPEFTRVRENWDKLFATHA